MVEVTNEQLLEQARIAWSRAYAKYSKYKVGAAVLTKEGKIILGCNIENSSYGGTICAERSGICSAISQGFRDFEAIAVVVDAGHLASPCGICRQFMVEFGNYKVILGTVKTNDVKVTSTYDLLPYAFTPKHLEEFDQVNGHNTSHIEST